MFVEMPQRKLFVPNTGTAPNSHCALCNHDGNLNPTPPRRRILTERNDLAGYSPSPVSKMRFGDQESQNENIVFDSDIGFGAHGVFDLNELRRGSENRRRRRRTPVLRPSPSPVSKENAVPTPETDFGDKEGFDSDVAFDFHKVLDSIELRRGSENRLISPFVDSAAPAAPTPYDPETNYLSPRPRFLCYRPNPRIGRFRSNEEDDLNEPGDRFLINRRFCYGNQVEELGEAPQNDYDEDYNARRRSRASSMLRIIPLLVLLIIAFMYVVATRTHFEDRFVRDLSTELANASVDQSVDFDSTESENKEHSNDTVGRETEDTNIEMAVYDDLEEEIRLESVSENDKDMGESETEPKEQFIEEAENEEHRDDTVGRETEDTNIEMAVYDDLEEEIRLESVSENDKDMGESETEPKEQFIEEAANVERKSPCKDLVSATEAMITVSDVPVTETQPIGFSDAHSEADGETSDSNQLSSHRTENKLLVEAAFCMFAVTFVIGTILIKISRYVERKRSAVTAKGSVSDNETSNSVNGSNETYGRDGVSAKGSALRSCSAETTKKGEERRLKSGSILTSAISYGSFTIYEKLPAKKGRDAEDALTPVRRSSRIRNRFAYSG